MSSKKANDSSVADGKFLTSDQGVRMADNQNSLKAGARDPSLLEEHFLRKKITQANASTDLIDFFVIARLFDGHVARLAFADAHWRQFCHRDWHQTFATSSGEILAFAEQSFLPAYGA